MKTKICPHCFEEFPIQEIKYNYLCISCWEKKIEREREERFQEGLGFLQGYEEPLTYCNDFQREVVESTLTSIGWKFNPLKQIWWKLPYVDENGNWLILKKNRKPKKRREKMVASEIINKIFFLREHHKMSFKNIAFQLNLSIYDVYAYYEKKRRSANTLH